MAFILTGTGRRVADSFEKVGGMPARLHVAWSPVGPPPAWLTRYFGDPTAPQAAPDADPDGDTLSNQAEYVIGSDPTDAASGFRIEAERHENGSMILRYAMRLTGADPPGLTRVYDLQTWGEWNRGQWVGVAHETSLPATGAPRSFTNVVAGMRFYRVRVRLVGP